MERLKIKKGDSFLCVKDFVMWDGEVSYKKDNTYLSEVDNCITDEQGNKEHFITSKFEDYFVNTKDIASLTNTTSNKALRYNSDKPKYSLLDLKSMEPGVRVLEFGAKKYAPNNWKKGMPMSEILDSMMRHIAALQSGEYIDPESGLPHTGHIQCNALFLGGPNVTNDMTLEGSQDCCGDLDIDGRCKCFKNA